MKKLITLSIMTICFVFYGSFAVAADEASLKKTYQQAFEYAAEYSLAAMRPTAKYRKTSILRAKLDGDRIKARVHTTWVTAFTGRNRNTVIDVWLKNINGNIYLVHYTLYADDHNIPIGNSQDTELKVQLNEYKPDDF